MRCRAVRTVLGSSVSVLLVEYETKPNLATPLMFCFNASVSCMFQMETTIDIDH